jgi:hypothetical protein
VLAVPLCDIFAALVYGLAQAVAVDQGKAARCGQIQRYLVCGRRFLPQTLFQHCCPAWCSFLHPLYLPVSNFRCLADWTCTALEMVGPRQLFRRSLIWHVSVMRLAMSPKAMRLLGYLHH